MTKALKSKRKMTEARKRLKRMEEVLEPFRKAPTPQSKPPKSGWIPGDYVIVRKDETVRTDHHCVVVE